MYKRIMVPVDLAHLDRLDKALRTAADLAALYDASVCYVGVTTSQPSRIAHNPAEYARKLEAFGQDQAKAHSLRHVTTAAYPSHDPAVDLDRILTRAITDSDSDLVVMASHKPGLAEYVFASRSGWLAAHAQVSVMVIR